MPYVVLPAVNKDSRLALAGSRWAAMGAAHPDLRAAITLQQRLIGLVVDLDESLAGRVPRLSLPQRYVTAKLSAGIPALSGEPVQLPVDRIEPTLLQLCRALAEGGGGEATLEIRTALEHRRLNVAALLALTLRREQGALRAVATKAGLGHDLLWLVTDLAVSPLAHALLRSIFGAVPDGSPLAAALEAWSHGYCPLCGTWPAFGEPRGDARRLRCSFCAAAWDVPRGSCVYCGERGSHVSTHTPAPNQPSRAVDTCTACRGYLKVVDTDTSLPFPLLALADLESMDLDLAAMQKGCARPAIKQFAKR
jgi:FdhE protein